MQKVWSTVCRWNRLAVPPEHWRTDESTVSVHLNSGPHTLADRSVMVVKHAHHRDPCLRRIRESRWIGTLGTLFPPGMNVRDDRVWNLPPFNTSGTPCTPLHRGCFKVILKILIRPRCLVYMWRTLMLNCRMAQTTKWLPATLDYTKNVMWNIWTCMA